MHVFRFWTIAALCLGYGSCNIPKAESPQTQEPVEGISQASQEARIQTSNFPDPVAGKLQNRFQVSITWEKTYESSLRDVKPERLDGFQGPWLEQLISSGSQGNSSTEVVYVQFPQLTAESVFDGTDLQWENHQIKDLNIDWDIERAGYTFGPDEPVFKFTSTQFEEVRAVEGDYLIVGSNYFMNPKEGLPNVYCIRSPEDELPFGPHSFDVLNDKLLALADPLKNRLVLLDNEGVIRMVHKLEFSPSQLQYKRNLDKLEVFDPQEERHYELNVENYLGPAQEISEEEQSSWRRVYLGEEKLELTGRQSGSIFYQGNKDFPADQVNFQVATDQGKILSVHSLGRDDENQKFVLLHMEYPDKGLYNLIIQYNSSNQAVSTLEFPFSSQVIYLENEFRIYKSQVYRLESKDQEYFVSTYLFP